jgi:hypothetical protein
MFPWGPLGGARLMYQTHCLILIYELFYSFLPCFVRIAKVLLGLGSFVISLLILGLTILAPPQV